MVFALFFSPIYFWFRRTIAIQISIDSGFSFILMYPSSCHYILHICKQPNMIAVKHKPEKIKPKV